MTWVHFCDIEGYYSYAQKCPHCDLGLIRIKSPSGLVCDQCGFPKDWVKSQTICPFCNSESVYRATEYAVFRCKNCKRYFDPGFQQILPGDLLNKCKENKEEYMGTVGINEMVAKHFPKTEDAMLVARWFGPEMDKNPKLFDILITEHEEEILIKAKELEKEENEKKSGQ